MFDEKHVGPGITVTRLHTQDCCVLAMTKNPHERFATAISSRSFCSGIHMCEISILACRQQIGGIFVGLAQPNRCLDGTLIDPGCGYGWGKGTPHIAWIELGGVPTGAPTRRYVVPARGTMTRPYPHYLRRNNPNIERRHHLFRLDPPGVSNLLAQWGLRHHAAVLRGAGVDGAALQALTAADLEMLGVRCPVERQTLLTRIRRHFEEELSYRQGAAHLA